MRGLSIRLLWNGIWGAHPDPEWPKWFQKYHKCLFYPSRTANGTVMSNQHRKVKIGQPMSGFLGIPDQRTAYVKRQVRPGWTYVRRSSVTPDLFEAWTLLTFATPSVRLLLSGSYACVHGGRSGTVFGQILLLLIWASFIAAFICRPTLAVEGWSIPLMPFSI